jgi:membrane protein implicated in regulation of membrane protease activity
MEFTIYGICFGVGLFFTIGSAFLGHVLGGHDAHTDIGSGGHAGAGFDHGGMPGMSMFSPTVMAAFVTSVGGLGMIFSTLPATRTVWLSAPLALLGGFLMAFGVFVFFNAVFKRTQGSSESRVGSLLGQAATIVTPIPAHGVGEIAYVQAGTRYTAPARIDSDATIPAGESVIIVRIVGTQFYVQTV